MIGTLKFGGNSANWAWYRTADKGWVADVLGQVHTKVDGKYVPDPRYHIKVWRLNAKGGHSKTPDFEFTYKPKTIPASGDKLTERTLNKVVREHVEKVRKP